jgi:hypothetical protein
MDDEPGSVAHREVFYAAIEGVCPLSSHSDPPDDARAVGAARDLRVAAIACGAAIAAGTAGGYAFNAVWPQVGFYWFATFYFERQDALWLIAIALFLCGLGMVRLPTARLPVLSAIFYYRHTTIGLLVVLILICGIVGTDLVFQGYHLSRDENLAEFAADTFRSGMAVAPVSLEWRHFANALQPRFMLSIADGAAFVPGYLPVNAGFRAVVGLVADPAWTGPGLAALAVLAVFGVARRLWPTRPDAAVISAILLATSSQVLVTSMTSYAMTAHLTLNLIWLWLFLRDDKIGHAGAIGIGFLACGLHQLIFHPLFALPFFIKLWAGRRWRLALAYIVSYAGICIFWIGYPQLVLDWYNLSWQGRAQDASGGGAFLNFAMLVLSLLLRFKWAGAGLMLENLLRFVAWQNPILLPLAAVGYRWSRMSEGIAGELFAGLIFTLIAMFVLLPEQGPGWGYRYLHGLIGSLALLAGYGWIGLSVRASRDEMAASGRMFVIAGGVAWLILLPAHAWDTHEFVMPYARSHDAIEHAPTDLVVVDVSGLLIGHDLVRNDPFLRNRPKVFDLVYLTETDIADLCVRYSIALFDRSQAFAFGILPNDMYKSDYETLRRNRNALARLSCGSAVPVGGEHSAR